jgi:glycosyltransferase involved in cell wall biosynthesis
VSAARRKLTLDVGPLFDDVWTGIPVFTRRLIRALQMSEAVDLEFVCDLVRLPAARIEWALRQSAGGSLHEALAEAQRGIPVRADLTAPILYPSQKPLRTHLKREASTVHDLSTLVMPENHLEANVAGHLDTFEEELETDEVVFCISQATRAALVTVMPSYAAKTRLLPQYVDWPAEFSVMERNAPRLKLGRYAVVIGTVEPRKNLGLVLRALALPEIAKSDLNFVVVGKRGWLVDSFMETLTPEQRQRVRFAGFVTEFVKYRLIANAEFLVFPSLYEGFGIPALEAMSLGKPVLASRSSSFPEVVGEGGLLFDPFSVEDFAQKVLELSQPRRQAELAPRARAQCSTFTPARMAAPVLEWAKA